MVICVVLMNGQNITIRISSALFDFWHMGSLAGRDSIILPGRAVSSRDRGYFSYASSGGEQGRHYVPGQPRGR